MTADPALSRPTLVIDARVVDSGGLGRYFRNVVSGIVRRRRFDVVLLGDPERLKRYPWAAETRVVNFPYPLYSIAEQIGFWRRIPSCDLFWSPHYNVPLLPLRSRRRLVTIHDGLHFFMWKDLSPLKQLYVRVVMGHGVRASDAVITVSEYARREIELHVRARGRRIEVIHNGIESDFGSGGERPVETTPYFLFVGNVKPHKNLKTALVAFRQFLTAHPEYRFCIAGKKDTFRINDDEIDAVVATIPSGAIQFLGEVSEEALKSLYRHASAFVYPSLYEGFGIPILEAMAFDIPIIASNTTSIPEVGGNAIEYFDPADASSVHAAMCRVTAPGFSVDRAQYAAQRERFSLERCVARHLEVLISLSAPAGPGPR